MSAFKQLSLLFLIFQSVLLCLSGCRREQQNTSLSSENEQAADSLEQSRSIPRYLITVVNNIRIRSGAGLGQNVLFTLPQATKLLYMSDSTKYLEKISINGIPVEKPWYKVKYEKLDSGGWVFGGGVVWESIPNEDGNLSVELLPSRLISKVKDGLAANLNQVLQVDIPGQQGLYNGYYEYRLNTKNERVLDGALRLETNLQTIGYNRMAVEGQYTLGQKDGLFIYSFYGQDIEYQVGIYFDKTTGLCQHGFVTGSIHDQLIDLNDLKSKDCTVLSFLNAAKVNMPTFL